MRVKIKIQKNQGYYSLMNKIFKINFSFIGTKEQLKEELTELLKEIEKY